MLTICINVGRNRFRNCKSHAPIPFHGYVQLKGVHLKHLHVDMRCLWTSAGSCSYLIWGGEEISCAKINCPSMAVYGKHFDAPQINYGPGSVAMGLVHITVLKLVHNDVVLA